MRILLLLLLVLSHPAAADGPPLNPAQDPGISHVFDLTALPSLTLTVAPEQWNILLADFDANPRNEKKVQADFQFTKNGKTQHLGRVGIRLRGNLSRKRPEGDKGGFHQVDAPQWHHAHFKVDFNKYEKKQTFHGLKALNLKFFNNDPTHVREVFAYDTLRRFGVWTTPYSSYARLYVQVTGDAKPAYFGLYQMVEQVDKHFLQVRFGKNDARGDLWKCLYQKHGPADLTNGFGSGDPRIGTEDIHLDETRSKRPSYDLKTNKDEEAAATQRFIAFLDKLNGLEGKAFDTWFAQTFDVDQFLRFLAANTLLGMWDDYWVNANNFYLYLHPSGKAFFVPYDYDNCLGTSFIVHNAGTQDLFNWGPMDPSRPLVYKVLSQPHHRARYAAHIRALIDHDGLLAPEPAMARVRTFQALIADHVADDTVEGARLEDKPADWARKPYYRLLTGNADGVPPESNYFATRARFAREQLTRAGF